VRTQYTHQAKAAETIKSALEESKTDADDLAQLLNFNYLIKSERFEDALAIIEEYRGNLLKYLGREAPGYDPLDQHQDLKQQVDDGDMSRAAALEVVRARAVESRARADQERQAQSRQQSEQAVRTREQGLEAIKQWEMQMAASDPAFSQKASILESRIKDIITRFPPSQWAQAMALAYEGITVPASQGGGAPRRTFQRDVPSGDDTLRPTGGRRPGGPAAKSMLEALSTGLGYQDPGQ